ncbi:MAG: hypothetical protein IJ418_16820 [Clostridia bacterium]|nr:hypothetical protein [Clostridia bacterium]
MKRREKIEKEDVIFIVLEKLNEKIPMDEISRSLFAQLMIRMIKATGAQSQGNPCACAFCQCFIPMKKCAEE